MEEDYWNSKLLPSKQERKKTVETCKWSANKNSFVLRLKRTEAEDMIWNYLVEHHLKTRIRFQHPILINKPLLGEPHYYIADFYDKKTNTVYEIDGGYHTTEEQIEKDKIRTEELAKYGIKVIRFTNEEVFDGSVFNKFNEWYKEYQKKSKRQ